ncbi:fumarylacetoacetate hydrolase family protein [Corynebacterium sp. H113]|uniref:fumarylacetoacetate hydrolase family protein n=1 Tax=Corynebacterium sp. H113 TaxID=3133419 RepID=UPI003095C41D
MRLATLRHNGSTHAALLRSTSALLFDESCVGSLLAQEEWADKVRRKAEIVDPQPGEVLPESEWAFAPLIPRPGKIVCVGLNYAAHIEEMGHERPEVPTLFAKFADAVAGARDDVIVPESAGVKALDYEGELAVVLGETVFGVDEAAAEKAIAGYAIMDDFTQRDKQYATQQWLQGKTLQRASGFGPWLLTADEFDAEAARVRTWVDGELRQDAPIADLVFPPAMLVSYVSQFVQLNPGDVISTGTPAGVGHGMKPPVYLQDGQVVRVAIDGLGEQQNTIRIR